MNQTIKNALHFVHGLFEIHTQDDTGRYGRINHLLGERFDELGNGAYATAYDIGDNICMKFGRELHDDQYPHFIEYLQNTEESPHLPKVLHYETHPFMDGFLCFMPMYHSVTDHEPNINLHDVIESIYAGHPLKNINTRMVINTIKSSREWMNDDAYNALIITARENRELFNVMYDIKRYARESDESLCSDLHDGNFMVDPDTDLMVITDPWG